MFEYLTINLLPREYLVIFNHAAGRDRLRAYVETMACFFKTFGDAIGLVFIGACPYQVNNRYFHVIRFGRSIKHNNSCTINPLPWHVVLF